MHQNEMKGGCCALKTGKALKSGGCFAFFSSGDVLIIKYFKCVSYWGFFTFSIALLSEEPFTGAKMTTEAIILKQQDNKNNLGRF